jgi:hypothetical protein
MTGHVVQAGTCRALADTLGSVLEPRVGQRAKRTVRSVGAETKLYPQRYSELKATPRAGRPLRSTPAGF